MEELDKTMKIIECPRDAMQGLHDFIPTDIKVKYINSLLKVGFDTIDFGSFVSPKTIPQMKDTSEVLAGLDFLASTSKLLAIVANLRGVQEAVAYKEIAYLGFPFSISETFQQRNTNKSITQALNTLQEIQDICQKYDKELVAYISMGFGNPYDDPYSPELVAQFTGILANMDIRIVSLADTIGVSNPDNIKSLFLALSNNHPQVEFGVHLHSHPSNAVSKIEAAYQAGCRRFDGAINGMGGCPMAKDNLVGNIATETIIDCLKHKSSLNIDQKAFAESLQIATDIF